MKIWMVTALVPISGFVLVVIAFEDVQSQKQDFSIQNGQAEQIFLIEIEADLNSQRRPWTPAGFSRRKKWGLRLQTSVSAVDRNSFAAPKRGVEFDAVGSLNTNDIDDDGLKIQEAVGRSAEDNVDMEVPPSDEESIDVDLDLDEDEFDEEICGTESTTDTTTTAPTDTTPPTTTTNSTTPTTTTDNTQTDSTISTTTPDPRDSTASSDPTPSTPTSPVKDSPSKSRRKPVVTSTRRRKIVDCSTATSTEESTTSSDAETPDATFSTSSTMHDTSYFTTSEVSPTVTTEANAEVSNETFMFVFGGILAAATVAVYAWHMRNLFKFKVAIHVGKQKSYLEL